MIIFGTAVSTKRHLNLITRISRRLLALEPNETRIECRYAKWEFVNTFSCYPIKSESKKMSENYVINKFIGLWTSACKYLRFVKNFQCEKIAERFFSNNWREIEKSHEFRINRMSRCCLECESSDCSRRRRQLLWLIHNVLNFFSVAIRSTFNITWLE